MTHLEKLSAPFQLLSDSDSGENVILNSLPPLDVPGLTSQYYILRKLLMSLFWLILV